MVLQESPDGVSAPPGGTNAPQFIHRRADFSSAQTGRIITRAESLSGEIIHHKNAPLFESSGRINPWAAIRLEAPSPRPSGRFRSSHIKQSFLCR